MMFKKSLCFLGFVLLVSCMEAAPENTSASSNNNNSSSALDEDSDNDGILEPNDTSAGDSTSSSKPRVTCYADLDQDGLGDAATRQVLRRRVCPAGLVSNGNDCYDQDDQILDNCSSCAVYAHLPDGSGSKDGSNWDNAYDTLQAAYGDAANREPSEACPKWSVWVAGEQTAQSDAPILCVGDSGEDWGCADSGLNPVNLFGGFLGTETDLSERPDLDAEDLFAGRTVLDGKDMSTHVVYIKDASLSLDRFYITGGNAGDFGSPSLPAPFIGWKEGRVGAGVFILLSQAGLSVELSNNIVRANNAALGGGVFAFAWANAANSSVTILNSTVSDNNASYGAGVFASTNAANSSVTILNSTVSDNAANTSGGGVYAETNVSNSSVTILNSTVSANNATYGGGMYASSNNGGISKLLSVVLDLNDTPAIYAYKFATGSPQICYEDLTGAQANSFGGDVADIVEGCD